MIAAVLGGLGLMGEAAVLDLCRQPDVSRVLIADRHLARKNAVLAKLPRRAKAKVVAVDLSRTAAAAGALRGARLVVNAAWYELNLKAMDLALALKAHYVDLGGLFHMTLRQLRRDAEFRRAGLLGLVGCGSTPGITNMMVAFLSRRFDAVREVDIFDASFDPDLGGDGFLPPFSIRTMLDENELPAPVVEGGRLRMVPANSLEEEIDFPRPIGRCSAAAVIHSEAATLPGFLRGRGLRRLAFKIGYPNLVKSQLAVLSGMGFRTVKTVSVKGVPVSPIDFLTALAQKGAAGLPSRPRDFEVLRVRMRGTAKGRRTRWELDAELKPAGALSAGAAGVGFTASIAGLMALRGQAVRAAGVVAPESALDPDLFFEEWRKRGIFRLKEHRKTQ